MVPNKIDPNNTQNDSLQILNNLIAVINNLFQQGKITAAICQDALKAIHCLRFIKVNKEYIKYAIDHYRDSTVYDNNRDFELKVLRDFNSTAFHIAPYFPELIENKNSKRITPKGLENAGFKSFGEYGYYSLMTEYVSEIETAYVNLQGQKSEEKVLQFISKFENDNNTGCLEKRFGGAKKFISENKTFGGRLSLEGLFYLAHNLAQKKDGHDSSADYIWVIFSYLAPFIKDKIECYDSERRVVTLTFSVVNHYLQEILFFDEKEIADGKVKFEDTPYQFIEIYQSTQESDESESVNLWGDFANIDLFKEAIFGGLLTHENINSVIMQYNGNTRSWNLTFPNELIYNKVQQFLPILPRIEFLPAQLAINSPNLLEFVETWGSIAAQRILGKASVKTAYLPVTFNAFYRSFMFAFPSRNEAQQFSDHIRANLGISAESDSRRAKYVHQKGTKFEVYLTETEPFILFRHDVQKNMRSKFAIEIELLAKKYDIGLGSELFGSLFYNAQYKAEMKLMNFLRSLSSPKSNNSQNLFKVIQEKRREIETLNQPVRNDLKQAIDTLLQKYSYLQSVQHGLTNVDI